MGFEQYHEPANELSAGTRSFARMIVSLTEEAEASHWYEQRISLEKNKSTRATMRNAQKGRIQTFHHGSRKAVSDEAAVARDRARRALPDR